MTLPCTLLHMESMRLYAYTEMKIIVHLNCYNSNCTEYIGMTYTVASYTCLLCDHVIIISLQRLSLFGIYYIGFYYI